MKNGNWRAAKDALLVCSKFGQEMLTFYATLGESFQKQKALWLYDAYGLRMWTERGQSP